MQQHSFLEPIHLAIFIWVISSLLSFRILWAEQTYSISSEKESF